MTPSLLYISMIGTPDMHNPAHYADLPDGGDDINWVQNRLREWGVLDRLDFRSADVTAGGTLPAPDGIAAVIVGGSAHSINEDRAWQRDLMAWLRRWRATGRPALGICGGRQRMCPMGGAAV